MIEDFFEFEALLLKEVEFFGKFEIIRIFLGFEVNIFIGFLSKDQLVSYFLYDIHEGMKEMCFLFSFVFFV